MLWQVTEASAQPTGRPSGASPDSARRVAVLTHMGRPAAIAAATRLIEGLSAAGIVPAVPAGDISVLDPRLAHGMTPLSKPVSLDDRIELMVVLGGDGTILRGTEWVMPSEIPLLGVNLGHVGFLAEAESSEIDTIVTHVVERSYTVEERFTIDVTLRDSTTLKSEWSSYAVNEVSIEKASRERMVEVNQLPRLPDAQETTDSQPDRVVYTVQGVVPSTVQSVKTLMADNGWMQYVRPLEETATGLLFKKGVHGLSVSFMLEKPPMMSPAR